MLLSRGWGKRNYVVGFYFSKIIFLVSINSVVGSLINQFYKTEPVDYSI